MYNRDKEDVFLSDACCDKLVFLILLSFLSVICLIEPFYPITDHFNCPWFSWLKWSIHSINGLRAFSFLFLNLPEPTVGVFFLPHIWHSLFLSRLQTPSSSPSALFKKKNIFLSCSLRLAALSRSLVTWCLLAFSRGSMTAPPNELCYS